MTQENAANGIPAAEFHHRQNAARRLLVQDRLDGLLAVGRSFYDRPGHVAYLCNHFPPFPSGPYIAEQGGLGLALFWLSAHQDRTILIADLAYRQDMVVAADVVLGAVSGDQVASVLRQAGLTTGRIAVAGEDMLPNPLRRELQRALPQLELVPGDACLWQLRSIKSPNEIQLLQRAADIAAVGLQAAATEVRRGATGASSVRECDVNAAGISAAMRAGADFIRYLRVHSGPYSGGGTRWPQAFERFLQPGEMVAMDIIGAYWGYNFDVLRCLTVGEPDDAQAAALEAAVAATEAVVAACRPGADYQALMAACRQGLENHGFAAPARAFLGHAIGLETMEFPYLQPDQEFQLQAGMVLCIEPVVRLLDAAHQGEGCSIEQEIVVRDGVPEILTGITPRLWRSVLPV